MNCTPKKWFKQLQLDLGRTVLMETRSVKLAAYESGYSQVTNFSRCLRINLVLFLTSITAGATDPILQLNVDPTATVTISGAVGSTYRVDFRTNMQPSTTWQALGQITLTQASGTVIDENIPLGFERYYRSVTIPAAAGLQLGESYSFISVSGGITNKQTLIVSSVQSGWLIDFNTAPPNSGIRQVSLSYEDLGPVSSRITAIVPGDGGAIPAQTNEFILIFNAVGAGAFERTGSDFITRNGGFIQDTSLVGQNITLPQIDPGETYSFVTISAGITNKQTLIVSSAQSGWLIDFNTAPPNSGIRQVSLSYEDLGPVSSRITAIVPGDGGAIPAQTNEFILIFNAVGAGAFERTGSDFITRTGGFVRDTSLVGQNITLPQIDPGETYSFVTISAGITNQQTLVISSTQSGWLIGSNTAPPNNGIRQVSLSYEQLGPISSRITAIIPSTDGGATSAQTNTFLLLHNLAGGGQFESRNSFFLTPSTGTFSRDRSLVGQEIAGSQLVAGELYSLVRVTGTITNELLIAVSTASSGWLAQLDNQPPANGFQQVTLDFDRLGPTVSRLTAIVPGDGAAISARTNDFLFIYKASHSGVFEQRDGLTVNLGTFSRDVSFSNP